MPYIDLHTHSTCSDGTSTPSNLIREAAEAGLCAISLTDHDTMAGVTEAIDSGRKAGVEVIPGVELSANLDGKAVHILGYGIDRFNADLQALLTELQTIREERNEQILAKLTKLNIHIDRNELTASSSGLIGRPHIARLLVKQKVVRNIEQAFRDYLREGGRAYIAAARFPASETISRIKQAGGLAVLAHPTTLDKSRNRLSMYIKALHKQGLDGIEAIYPGHSKTTCKWLTSLAEELALIITGGSDFHGTVKQGINIGGAPVMPPVPYELLEKINDRLATGR